MSRKLVRRPVVDVDMGEISHPCLYYVAKRLNTTVGFLQKEKRWKRHLFDLSKVRVGDIVVWKHEKPSNFSCSDRITDTTVLTRWIDYSYHYGVYEGDGMVSHFTDESNGCPLQIRMISVKGRARQPTYFLRRRKVKK